VAAKKDLSGALSVWLSAPDPSSNLAAARDKRQHGTGVWLLESPTFRAWENEHFTFLVLYGKPGSGKTVLSSTVIHSLLESKIFERDLVYFYFDFQSREKQLVRSFWKSVIFQLYNQNDKTFDIVEELYNSHSRGRTTPTLRELKATARQMFESSKSVYLVLDALDECEDRRNLLESLRDLRSWNQEHVHVLATSRRETDIEDVLGTVASDAISLEECVVDGDIVIYVRHQLQHDEKLSRWPDHVRKEIEVALLEGAKGMFRWVECQLDAIRGCMKLGLLRRALKSLPRTLDDTYSRILDNIPEQYLEDARRILSCLICSFHPLAVQEIADTVAVVGHGETYYDVENRFSEPRDVLTICSGLVTTTRSIRNTFFGDRQLNIEELRLAHFSVKEYLISNGSITKSASNFALDLRYAHETLANLCMRYLAWCHEENMCEDPSFLQEYIRSSSEEVAFAPYAASSWSRHLRAAQLDSSSPLYDQCLTMLTDPALLRDIIRLHTPWFRYQELILMRQCGYVTTIMGNNRLNPNVEVTPPLYFASLFGMDQMVLMLLEKGENVDCSGCGGSCLTAAVCGGHESTVKLLISKGASINAVVLQTSNDMEILYSRTAIHEAVHHGNEEIVRILLAYGADVNIGRSCPGKVGERQDALTPLQEAVAHSRKHIVQLLLDAGADPNACAGYQGIPLEHAQFRESGVDMMTMLLDHGADPNMASYPGKTKKPLFSAIIKQHQPRIKLLIERGADLETMDSHFIPSVLLFPNSILPKIKTLLRLRADINVGRLLIAAVKYGHLDVVDFLLLSGVSPDSQESNGNAALHSAAFTPESSIEAINKLLNAGADINTYGGPLGSALQAAALSGKADVVKLLLQIGSAIDHAGGDYGTALKIAKNRLEDHRMGCPEIWDTNVVSYGPNGYFFWDGCAEYAASIPVRKTLKVGDYEAKIDIPHLPDADYQAVIDVLYLHNAKEV